MFRVLLTLGLIGLSAGQLSPVRNDKRPLPGTTTTTQRPDRPASYWVTFSKKARAGHPLKFKVHIIKGSSPVDVSISLNKTRGELLLNKGPITVQPGVPQDIAVDIPLDAIEQKQQDRYYYYYNDNFEVVVKGVGSEVEFKEKSYVTLEKKSFSIFVQTDKFMYKPSQTVQFRVLAMTPDMKVLRDVKQDIVVMDAKGNRILQYKGLETSENLGVVQKSFKLASSVPQGEWKIKVNIEGVEEEATFEVSDYVLPRFEVTIDAPSYGVTTNPIYEFTVKAMYTFGKPVIDGKVNVSIALQQWSSSSVPPLLLTGKLNDNGELKLTVTKTELLEQVRRYRYYEKTKDLAWRTFLITAKVTEKRTGKTYNSTHEVQFHKSPMKISFLGITPNSFKSGMDFTAYIEVRKQDDTLFTPEESRKIKVVIGVNYTVPKPPETTTATPPILLEMNDTTTTPVMIEEIQSRLYYEPTTNKQLKLEQSEFNLPDNGWVLVTFRVPDEARNVQMKAHTVSPLDPATAYKYVEKSYSPSESFLQLSVINEKPKVGDLVRVQAKATDEMKLLTYQVFSKGLLLVSEEMSGLKGPTRSLEFQFEAKVTMSPSMSIVAFYIRDNGEFVVDALSLSVEGLFDNAVTIEFNKEKVQPGENVNAIIKGEKDSIAFVTAVDRSVQLLGSKNELTQDRVIEELAKYDYGNYGFWRYMFICGWPSYFGGTDASSVLQSAGVNVITDGYIYSRYDDPNGTWWDRNLPVPANSGFGYRSINSVSKPVSKSVKTRKRFPETWLWNIAVLSNGEVVIPLTAQDTITTWVASVFSVNPRNGLSVAAKPAKVTTFINLFVSLDLPTSIVRHEDFCFPVSVFNYYPGEVPVLLTLNGNANFKSVYPKDVNGKIESAKENLNYSHFLGYIKENEIKTESFCFTPNKIGPVTILVTAMTGIEGLSDRVERQIHVKPEGVPRATTFPYMVELENGVWTKDVQIFFPDDTVKGSEKIHVNIAGNLLGGIFDNLEDLLQKPYGCGEQNMINFSPIMSLLDFFFTTNTITEEFKQKAVSYMLIGYQKEVLYEHGTSGGFSTFGNRETKENPSMWLTAFVIKCFAQAELLDMEHQNILAIDTNILLRSSIWMLSQQARNGSFVENGRVFNKRLQGGSGKGISLSAYTLIALHHVQKVFANSVRQEIQSIEAGARRVTGYLERNIFVMDDPYDVCITAYALNLVNSKYKNEIFNKMELIAQKGFGVTYWERPNDEPRKPVYYYWSRNDDAISIEMTAYALLTYALQGKEATSGLPVVRWLSKKKGPNGGFISTQDTVIGIEALTTVSKKLYGSEFVPMTIQVSSRGEETTTFQVTKQNEMILQRKDIPYKTGGAIQLNAQANGNQDSNKSTVLVDVVFNYNIIGETQVSVYNLSYDIVMDENGYNLYVKVWTVDGKSASMTMVEMEIPTGYFLDQEKFENNNNAISSYDVKGDFLNIYIDTDKIKGDGIKLVLPMLAGDGNLITSDWKSLKVYSYYDPEIELTRKFRLKDSDLCSQMPSFGVCSFI